MNEWAETALAAAIASSRQDGSEAIVMGSGGYAGRRQQISHALAMPFIDGREAALLSCETAAFNQSPTTGSLWLRRPPWHRVKRHDRLSSATSQNRIFNWAPARRRTGPPL